MNCPNCGAPNEAGRKFCGECGNRLAVACANCGTANAPGTRFCGECGTPLQADSAADRAPGQAQARGSDASSYGAMGAAFTRAGRGPARAGAAAGPIAERRHVTVLFADLVGFTTISEGRDPEEVRELLSRYFDTAREQIERYGGTVEKFIGDAVMAVWGAPTAHEDDAERGVRAALEVVDAVKDLAPGLQARAGVVTGEAAVTVGARGEGMVAGDLVNTASRLQSVAQPGMVLVGETTKHTTEGSIAYEPAGEQLLKGKTAPVTAYHALRVVARRGGAGRGDRLEPPFVGRDSELRLLKDLFHTTSREKRVRLVSVTGQAGVGKSRLAWELRKYGDGVAQDIFWHEGRSPAYGQGITFWALGEMVRARAQLLETDDPETTRAKLATSVARWFPEGEERDRVVRALQALLGVGEAPGGTDELFGAWRLDCERMAEQFRVTMVFEDLHWADPGTLDFIDHVLEWSRNVPILIVTLARPTLLEHRPDWGAGRRNFLALDLEPLGEEPMRELLKGLVPDFSEPAVKSIVARAEGIPLYAVETIRMLAADGRLRAVGQGEFEPVGELGELAVPDSLHALIAARLDALEPADRSLVQDAAVLGQSFTPAGLAAISGLEEATLTTRLRELVKADLLTEERDDRSPERGQFAFVQALIREVAYSTLSLKDRRSRHLAAARFFEVIGDEELAGALAQHYLAAYKSSREGEEAAALAAQARIALRAAADRANGLGSPRQAVSFLEQALEVTPDVRDQVALLEQAATAALSAADFEASLALARRLREACRAIGDRRGEAKSFELECQMLADSRSREQALQLAQEALREFEDLGDDAVILSLTSLVAQSAAMTGQYELGLERADWALAAAERQRNVGLVARQLSTKGTIAFFQGRVWEGIALVDGARRLAEQHGLTEHVLRLTTALSNFLALDDPRATAETERQIVELSRRLGNRGTEIIMLGNLTEDARRTGEWDGVLDEIEAGLRDAPDVTGVMLEAGRAPLLAYRGELDDDALASLSARIDATDDKDIAAGIYDVRAVVALTAGDPEGAATWWLQNAEVSTLNAPFALPKAGFASILAGDAEQARAILDRLTELGSRGRAIEADMAAIVAGIAGLRGDLEAARAGFRATRAAFHDLGLPWDMALSSILAGRTLGTSDPEVAGWLAEARETMRQLRARPMVDLIDGLPAAGAGQVITAQRRDGGEANADQAAESVSST
jgi:class 3 adenylate cyclase/tetratricopeptide (TPR) repeat protein